jgi:transposase
MTERRKCRTFTEEFKKQMVQLYNAGKPRIEIIREYDLSSTSFDKWVSASMPPVLQKSAITELRRKLS